MTRFVPAATSAALAVLAGLHVAWGAGSTFPAGDRAELADLIAGTDVVPAPRECFTVAGLLFAASAVVAGVGSTRGSIRRLAVVAVAGVLGGRGATGLARRTGALVPWEPSPRFVELDRRYYGPLCVALAVGSLSSSRTLSGIGAAGPT